MVGPTDLCPAKLLGEGFQSVPTRAPSVSSRFWTIFAVALAPHAQCPNAQNEIVFMIILDVPPFCVSHTPPQPYYQRVIVQQAGPGWAEGVQDLIKRVF